MKHLKQSIQKTGAKQMTPEQAAVKVDEMLRAFEEACEHLGAHMLRGRVPAHEIEERARLRGELRARLLAPVSVR